MDERQTKMLSIILQVGALLFAVGLYFVLKNWVGLNNQIAAMIAGIVAIIDYGLASVLIAKSRHKDK